MEDIFEPYEKLIEIKLDGVSRSVPANNSILRCLQYLDMEKISHADLCWNGECLDCCVSIKVNGRERSVIACRTNAADGMEITRLPQALK